MASTDEDARQAVSRLFDLYADDIYRFVRFSLGNPAEVEDIVQDVFLQAMRSWGGFRGASSEKTWLWSIARHRMVDWIRRRGRETTGIGEDMDRLEGAHSDPDALIDLELTLRRLPMEQRQVLILRIVQDKSSAEAAGILGWSNVRVRVTLHRALKALEGLLAQEESSREGEGGNRGGQGMEKGLRSSVGNKAARPGQGKDSPGAGAGGRVWRSQPEQ